MSRGQRIVKYLSLALAFFLIISIISGITNGVLVIFNIFSNESYVLEDMRELDIIGEVNTLEIEVETVKVIFKEGDEFLVETNNNDIKTEYSAQKLKIVEDKDYKWFGNVKTSDLVVYLPTDLRFKEVIIKTGVGGLDIEKLCAQKLDLDLGVGKVRIEELEVTEEVEIEGGLGEVVIEQGILRNLDLDMGIGKLDITSKVIGDSSIKAGIGEIVLNLLGNLSDYRIVVDKGIGNIVIDDKEISDDTSWGKGSNKIKVNGGMGEIIIATSKLSEAKTFTRTYQLLNITDAQEGGLYYLTLQIFQGEVETVLVKNLSEKLEEGKNYEFNFSIDTFLEDDSISAIFENSEINFIRETDKVGLEQIQDSLEN